MNRKAFVDLLGTAFYYEMAGEGEPVVFIHAGICDGRMWEAQFAWFAHHFRVLRYDMRGFGKTAVSDTPYAHHHDLRALLDHLNLEQVHLVGCSKGGTTALDFALTFPQRVKSLSLVCSSPGGYKLFAGDRPIQWAALVAADEVGNLEKIARLETEIWVVGRQRNPDQLPAHILQLVEEMNLIALRNEYAELGEEQQLSPPALERLEEVSAPVLVMNGDLDEPGRGVTLRSGDAQRKKKEEIKAIK